MAEPRLADAVRRYINIAEPELKLVPWTKKDIGSPDVFAFQQENTAATRKKVATLCQTLKSSL